MKQNIVDKNHKVARQKLAEKLNELEQLCLAVQQLEELLGALRELKSSIVKKKTKQPAK